MAAILLTKTRAQPTHKPKLTYAALQPSATRRSSLDAYPLCFTRPLCWLESDPLIALKCSTEMLLTSFTTRARSAETFASPAIMLLKIFPGTREW